VKRIGKKGGEPLRMEKNVTKAHVFFLKKNLEMYSEKKRGQKVRNHFQIHQGEQKTQPKRPTKSLKISKRRKKIGDKRKVGTVVATSRPSGRKGSSATLRNKPERPQDL